MPLARYFFCVGAVLLALLFAIDTGSSKLPAADSTAAISTPATDVPAQRIHSDRKWPERVVFDTSMPTIVPAPAPQTVAAKPDVAVQPAFAEISAKTRVRETFAQFRPEDEKKPEVKAPPKRKVAKSRAAPPMMMVEQQPRFGLFGTW